VPVEIVDADLHQLVARVRLENGRKRLAAVAGRQQSRARNDVGELAAQKRHLHRVLGVRRVRIETRNRVSPMTSPPR